MSGAKHTLQLVISTILALFCIYIIKLLVSDELTLYIHPRYTLFAVAMSAAGLFMILAGLVVEARRPADHHHEKKQPNRFRILDGIVVGVLVLAFLIPAQTLSSNTTSRKSIKTPTEPVFGSHHEACPPTTETWPLQSWVYFLGYSPARCFEGKPITLIGSVIQSPDSPLPSGIAYVGRVVISCCVIDARPYALPVTIENAWEYPKDTWVEIKGTITLTKNSGKQLFVVDPQSINKIDPPKDNQYQYLNE